MSYAGKININNVDYPIASSLYGVCTTTGATIAKVVTLANFDALIEGVQIAIKFSYSNTAANPTLNVNATGARAIKTSNGGVPGITANTSWRAGSVVVFVYADNAWVIANSNSETVSALETSISNEVTRATTAEGTLTSTANSLNANKEPKKKVFTNTVVPVADFLADTTYTDFGYRAAIALTGVTASMIPWVAFSGNDASSGDFSTTANTYDGGVYIYSDIVPSADVTIPTIVCFSGESA